MNTTGLIIFAVVVAAALVAMLFPFRPRKPATAATATRTSAAAPVTNRRASVLGAVGLGSSSPDDATVPLLAVYAHDATMPAGHAPHSSCDHPTATGGHGDAGFSSDSGSCGGH